MTKRNNFLVSKSLIVLAFGFATALAVGCGDDDGGETAPTGGTKAMGGGGNGGSGDTKSGSGGGGTGNKSGSANGGTDSIAGGGAGEAEMGGEAGMGGAPDCTDEADKGCYSCKPKTLVQFLNHCPTTGCEPFDNTLLGSLKNDKLPDLP